METVLEKVCHLYCLYCGHPGVKVEDQGSSYVSWTYFLFPVTHQTGNRNAAMHISFYQRMKNNLWLLKYPSTLWLSFTVYCNASPSSKIFNDQHMQYDWTSRCHLMFCWFLKLAWIQQNNLLFCQILNYAYGFSGYGLSVRFFSSFNCSFFPVFLFATVSPSPSDLWAIMWSL